MEKQSKEAIGDPAPQRTENVRQWVTSPEGQKAIAASLQKAQSLTTQFCEAQCVDPESLNKPITL